MNSRNLVWGAKGEESRGRHKLEVDWHGKFVLEALD
jgi:hypothetical protein